MVIWALRVLCLSVCFTGEDDHDVMAGMMTSVSTLWILLVHVALMGLSTSRILVTKIAAHRKNWIGEPIERHFSSFPFDAVGSCPFPRLFSSFFYGPFWSTGLEDGGAGDRPFGPRKRTSEESVDVLM